jgi:putative ABC transport system permease protein
MLWNDLRFAARLLAKAPGFTAVAILTLALAIGANTALFTLVNGALLTPLPFPDPERLVNLTRHSPDGEGYSISVPKFAYWQEHSTSFASVTAFDDLGSGFNLAGDGLPERLVGSRVTHEFFDTFGVQPALGRGFLPEEDVPGARPAVVLSHRLWVRRFGGDPKVLGRPLTLNGQSFNVVGVAPESFQYPATAELWTPFGFDRTSQEKAHYFEVVARLKPGVELAAARSELEVVGRAFIAAHPDAGGPKETAWAIPVRERLYGRLRPALLVLLGAVGAVLLIACVNLANLQLARAAARQREIALRTALGASSGQIVRQLMAESLLLSLAGGVVGLLLGWALLPALLALAPDGLDQLPATIDGTVLAFTFGLALLSGLLFGLVPAFGAARPDLNDPLKEGTSRATGAAGGRGGQRLRRVLVAGEVALALVLLTMAGLLVRSFAGLAGTDPGFEADGVITAKVSLPEARYGDPAALARFASQITERLAAMPGVKTAGMTATLPLEGGPDLPFTIVGRYQGGAVTMSEEAYAQGVGNAQFRVVTPDLLRAFEIPVVRGRAFTAADTHGRELVALISETAARHYWPKQDPIGQRIHLGQPMLPELGDPVPRTIVGIVRDVREVGLDEAAPDILYVPLAQMPAALNAMMVRLVPMNLVVDLDGRVPPGFAEALPREVWAVDPQQPVEELIPMEQVVSRSLGTQRFSALLLGGLALLALLLAAVGIYGVLSYLVGQRTREIGVRMALGASGRQVLQMVVGQGLGAVAVGLAVGIAGAFALSRVVRSLLANVSPTDPVAFAVAPVVLALVALAASVLPARRASRLDPVRALRKD